MVFEVRFREEAQQDLTKAYRWYEDQKRGLGKNFISEVEAAAKYLSRNPEAFPEKKGIFRELNLTTFPYLMIYTVEGQVVTVFAIFNTYLNPQKKP